MSNITTSPFNIACPKQHTPYDIKHQLVLKVTYNKSNHNIQQRKDVISPHETQYIQYKFKRHVSEEIKFGANNRVRQHIKAAP